MAISIIIICLILQRLLLIDYYAYQLPFYLTIYFRWLIQAVEYITKGHPLVGVVFLVLPLVIVFTVIFAIAYHLCGIFGYSILSAILLWLSVDCRGIKAIDEKVSVIDDLFISAYQRFFAPVFWFVILGPTGLVLYTVTASLLTFLISVNELKLFQYTAKLKNYLDWIPLRLVGFSFALMGNFAVALKSWMGYLWQSPAEDREIIVKFGIAALVYSDQELSFKTAMKLIDRVIIFWLIVILLFTLEFWLG